MKIVNWIRGHFISFLKEKLMLRHKGIHDCRWWNANESGCVNWWEEEWKLTVRVCGMVSWHGARIVYFGKRGKPMMPRNREQLRDQRLGAMWIRCFCARNCSFPPIVECVFPWKCPPLAILRIQHDIRHKHALASNPKRYGTQRPTFGFQHLCNWSVELHHHYSNENNSNNNETNINNK